MKKTFTLFFGIALFCCITSTFAQGIYLEIPSSLSGIPSSSSATVEVVLSSVQYGIGVGTSGTGQPQPAAPSFSEITVTKTFDISSIALQRLISTATAPLASDVKINYYRAGTGGTRVLVYQLILQGAVLSGYSASTAGGCANGCPDIAESLSINYGKIIIIDSSQPGPPRRFGYNKITGQEF